MDSLGIVCGTSCCGFNSRQPPLDIGVANQQPPLFIELGNPWENGYIESLNDKMRDELLNLEIFYSLREIHVLIELWQRHYIMIRSRNALEYRLPVAAAVLVQPTQIQCVGLSSGLLHILDSSHFQHINIIGL